MHTEHRVFGPPGTGKTTYLAKNIRSAVRKYGPKKVLVTSFTKSAAVEITGRLGRDGIKPDRRQIGTLHSLCYELLGRPPIADLAPTMALWNEEHPGARQTAAKSTGDDPYSDKQSTEGDELRALCEVYRAQMVPVELWREERVKTFYKQWCEFKEETGTIDFTDMVAKVYESRIDAPDRPSVIFADETQDYSRLELELLRRWASDPGVDHAVIAGDDDQAIYGFKGASSDAFLNPPIPDEQKHVLGQSYRLPRKIKEFSGRWIKEVRRREPKEFSPTSETGSIEYADSTWADGYGLSKTIGDSLNGSDKSIMVLASCSYMLRPLIKELREQGIPFHNPYRVKNGAWNPMRGGVQRLLEFLSVDPFSNTLWTWKSLWRWLEVIDCKKSGISRGGKTHISELAKMKEQQDETVPLSDLLALFGSDSIPWEGRELEWFTDMVLMSKKPLMEFSLKVVEKLGIEGLQKKPQIVVGTIHSVKGGEADTTILLPDLSSSGLREYSSVGDGRDGVIRMFYVGMTRARSKLVLCDADNQRRAVGFRRSR